MYVTYPWPIRHTSEKIPFSNIVIITALFCSIKQLNISTQNNSIFGWYDENMYSPYDHIGMEDIALPIIIQVKLYSKSLGYKGLFWILIH